jgi:hypothetical protein
MTKILEAWRPRTLAEAMLRGVFLSAPWLLKTPSSG